MKPNRNRTRDLGFYVLLMVILILVIFTMTGEPEENKIESYSELVQLFEDEKVQYFETEGNTIKLKVRTDDPVAPVEEMSYDLYSFSVFYEDFNELINQQLQSGVLEGYDYIWLIWGFSANRHEGWSPTVRPPRLGGNERRGVFATRSPYRPNPLGLSSVKLDAVEQGAQGPVLRILGADLMDGTPVYDIKPYIGPDVHAGARLGFSGGSWERGVEVDFPSELLERLPEEKRAAAVGVLEQDPRPAYQHDAERVYGVEFAGFDIRFRVADGVLSVVDVVKGE